MVEDGGRHAEHALAKPEDEAAERADGQGQQLEPPGLLLLLHDPLLLAVRGEEIDAAQQALDQHIFLGVARAALALELAHEDLQPLDVCGDLGGLGRGFGGIFHSDGEGVQVDGDGDVIQEGGFERMRFVAHQQRPRHLLAFDVV